MTLADAWTLLGDWATVLLAINAVVVCIVLIYDNRDPSTTLAWIAALLLVPFAGLVFYFFFGRNWRRTATRMEPYLAARDAVRYALEPLYRAHPEAGERVALLYGNTYLGGVRALIEKTTGFAPLPAEKVELLVEGERFFDRMIADIAGARSFVHVQFFIWERDELTRRVADALLERMADGVEVRIMYDRLGSILYDKSELSELKAAGAMVLPERQGIGVLNYRDHLKIVVVDGRVGYTGGFNLGQEYIDGGARFESWRDTGIRIVGPATAQLQAAFAMRWLIAGGDDIAIDAYFPDPGLADPQSAIPVQMVTSSFMSPWPAIKLAYEEAVSAAAESVWIQSPYFVPDEALNSTLISSSLTDIDLRLMMTGVPDKRLAWEAAHSYFEPVLRAGGRILLYQAGFFHAKTIAIDHMLCAVGTFNLDTRSLLLHDELMCFIYDETFTRAVEASFEADTMVCDEITQRFLDSRGPWRRFRSSAGRLLAKLL